MPIFVMFLQCFKNGHLCVERLRVSDYFLFLPFLTVFDLAFEARPFAFALLFAPLVFVCGRCLNAECAAARRAIGTRNGEQET